MLRLRISGWEWIEKNDLVGEMKAERNGARKGKICVMPLYSFSIYVTIDSACEKMKQVLFFPREVLHPWKPLLYTVDIDCPPQN